MDQPGRAPALHQQLQHTAVLLQRVRSGASLTEALGQVPAALRPGCQALSFHVMRWRASAQAARAALAPKAPPPDVDALLVCALALLWPAGQAAYAEHTVVDETVKATRKVAPRSAGFVNAVLRNFLRRRDEVVSQVMQQDEARLNHPMWWIRRLRRDWPEQAEAIMAAAQRHPPMTLRASGRHGSRQALGAALDGAGLAWRPAEIAFAAVAAAASRKAAFTAPQRMALARELTPPQAATLERPVPVQEIPGFAQGHWSVQDAAAQLAAPLLLGGLEPGTGPTLRVLDACAAPGGKTAHLLDSADMELTALDSDEQRLQRVAQTLERLGLKSGMGTDAPLPVRLKAADARQVAEWWDGKPFDAILLDAPCSGSGIVRRHPDARWLRRDTDIPALARIQAELLDALWPLVRSGGRLLYATCSVFKAEGCEQIDAFLQRQGLPDSVIDTHSPGHLLPLVDNPSNTADPAPAPACDGFFYALLHKP